MRFVVADDSKVTRRIISDIVSKAGHTVVAECSSADDALSLCKKHAPDVAILDLSMPGNNAGSHVKTIAKSKLAKHVIVSSVLVGNPMFEQWNDLHLATVQKPVSSVELIAVINNLTADNE